MARPIRTIDRPSSRARGGFTLAESLIASVALAAATAGVVVPILAASQHSRAARCKNEAVSLAQQLMEEIIAKPFADPTDGNLVRGPEADEPTRANFDNVDDYDGYADTTAALSMLSGLPVSLQTDGVYSRRVTVRYRTEPAGPEAPCGDFALVTVTVTPPQGTPVELRQLAARFTLKR